MTIILAPLPFNVLLGLVLLGIAYALFSVKLQRKVAHPQKQREIQQKINLLTKEMRGPSAKDPKTAQAEMMALVRQSMGMQLKTMVVMLPMLIAVYYVILPNLFGSYIGEGINFIIPLTYSNIFIASVFISGLVVGIFMMRRDKRLAQLNAVFQQQT